MQEIAIIIQHYAHLQKDQNTQRHSLPERYYNSDLNPPDTITRVPCEQFCRKHYSGETSQRQKRQYRN